MLSPNPSTTAFQVGGSLQPNAPTYVVRQADRQLYQSLRAGEFCYVLNTRQVGKSSLRVRTKSQLEAEGYRCASVDMTSIGSETVTDKQWYKGFVAELWRGFGFGVIRPFKTWWQEQGDITAVQFLHNFIEDVLFVQVPNEIVIFIDEIDSVLSLPFPVGDLFAFIRFCYDCRSENTSYKRLSFALFGVATPSDLIRSQSRTPFNIGCPIDLCSFSLAEAQPLAENLYRALPALSQLRCQELLQAILVWTGGQPFLTQRLCQLTIEQGEVETAGLTAQQVIDHLIAQTYLTDWKRYDQPEHIRTVRDRILVDETRSERLLGIYQQILRGRQISSDDSRDQMELMLSGLLLRHQGHLHVKCRLYQAVLNQDWVERHLDLLRPYAPAIRAWEKDPTDESRLLRGKALADAQAWADQKSLSDLDYQFLVASEAFDRRLVENSLQLARAQEVSARLAQEEKSNRQQRRLIAALTGLLLLALGLGGLSYISYRRALASEQETALAAVQSKVASSEALFGSNQRLDALLIALQAKRQLASLPFANQQTTASVDSVLRRSVYRSLEQNRWQQGAEIRGLDISADGRRIVTAALNGVMNVWQSDGKRLASFQEKDGVDGIFAAKFNPRYDEIATASSNGSIQLWSLQGDLLRQWVGLSSPTYNVAFSPDGERLVSAGADGSVNVWTRQGQRLHRLQGHQGEVWGLAISPDGELIASGSRDQTVKIWSRHGTLLYTLTGYQGAVRALAFSPDGQTLVTGSDDSTVWLWSRDGQLISTYRAHDDAVQAVAYAANGRYFVTASWDQTLRVWSPEGLLLRQLQGHRDRVWTVAITPNSQRIFSGSWDQGVRVWQLQNTLTTPLLGHTAAILGVAFAPNGQTIASASDDRTVRLWQPDGNPERVLRGHRREVYGVAFSPDGRFLISSSLDQTLNLWDLSTGKRVRTLTGHTADIWGVAFSPNNQLLASASHDGTARLWDVRTGKLVQVLRGHQSRVQQVVFSPDGQTLVTVSSDKTGRIWNLQGQTLAILHGHQAGVLGVSMSPDGSTIATASLDKTIRLWNRNGQWLQTLTGHPAEVSDVKFRPDGQMLASSDFGGNINLWRLEKERLPLALLGASPAPTIQPWRGSFVSTLEGHQGRVWRLAWSPNGNRLVSAGEDKLVLLWDLAKVQNMAQVQVFGCRWLADYLRTNPNLTPRDRQVCRPLERQKSS